MIGPSIDLSLLLVLAGCSLVSANAAVLGTLLSYRRKALASDTIAHSVLPGICIAFLATESKYILPLLIGGWATGFAGVLLSEWLAVRKGIKTDASISFSLSFFFGMGVVLLTFIQQLPGLEPAGLDRFLFGQAATMLQSDLITLLVIAVLSFSFIIVFYRVLILWIFDTEFAEVSGIGTRLFAFGFYALFSLVVVSGIQTIGAILVTSLVIAPSVTARFLGRGHKSVLIVSGFVGMASGLLGATITWFYGQVPTGPIIALTCAGFAFLAIFFAPGSGLISRIIGHRRRQRRIGRENALKAVFQYLERMERKPGSLVENQRIAEPTASILPTLEHLRKARLVAKDETGYRLTPEGFTDAKRIVRLHRLWELYLSQHLGLKEDHLHADAEGAEHFITPEIEKRLMEKLNHPEMDPHRKEIPY